MSSEDEVKKRVPPSWAIPIISRMRELKAKAEATAEAARIAEAPEDPAAIHQAYLEEVRLRTAKEGATGKAA